MNCWSCAKPLDAQDAYCRFCGQGQGENVPWYYHPAGIGVMTLFLMGPFSLYFVWKSPRLSPSGRWIATGLILAFTLYLGYSTFAAVRMVRAVFAGAF